MRKGILLFILILTILFNAFKNNAQTSSTCNNTDFELGNFTNWTGYTGRYPGTNVVITGTGIVSGRHTITYGNGWDNNSVGSGGTHISIVAPNNGLYSCRLGNSSVGAQAERLEYTMNVTAQSTLFYYWYAVVLQDPSHTATQQPKFEIEVLNSSGVLIDPTCGHYLVVSAASIPGFYTSTTGLRCKDWTLVGMDLSQYLGQNIIISFTTNDCSLSGHYGYAYMEAGCAPNVVQDFKGLCVGDVNGSYYPIPTGNKSLFRKGRSLKEIKPARD